MGVHVLKGTGETARALWGKTLPCILRIARGRRFGCEAQFAEFFGERSAFTGFAAGF